jgi:hypothetical protein
VLASLLPGLRDVRTPLTVGYLWLGSVWVMFFPSIPERAPQADGMVSRAFAIADELGAGATFAALSFLAYVLGAVATVSIENTRSGREWQHSLPIT